MRCWEGERLKSSGFHCETGLYSIPKIRIDRSNERTLGWPCEGGNMGCHTFANRVRCRNQRLGRVAERLKVRNSITCYCVHLLLYKGNLVRQSERPLVFLQLLPQQVMAMSGWRSGNARNRCRAMSYSELISQALWMPKGNGVEIRQADLDPWQALLCTTLYYKRILIPPSFVV